MDYDRFVLATRAARPEDVLAIFQDAVRLSGEPPPTDSLVAFELTDETPVDEWRAVMRSVWQGASPSQKLEAWFDVHAAPADWERVLQPGATVREVCELVASQTRLPVIRPVPFFGGSSDAIGAFLAVRELMRQARLEIGDLAPTSPLAPYLNERGELLPKLILLAPGRLPAARRIEPDWIVWPRFVWAVLVGVSLLWSVMSLMAVLFGLINGWGWGPVLSLGAATAMTTFIFLSQPQVQSMFPYELRLGELTTFRDLSYALVCRRRRRSRRGMRAASPPRAGNSAPAVPRRTPVESLPQT